ncbi:MAG TPA: DHHA1 domain-containing protein [Fusibacter sp.]|nr:DHHA1 domain-containing protein [Fusibacter sp.]
MTVKHYNTNAYIKEFQAKVVALVDRTEGNAIVLDATYFYPEGGGQPCDLGMIDGVKIKDVIIEDDIIYHITDASIHHLTVDQSIDCTIDFDRRFAFMQQHTGQHILSSCAEKLFDANTIGFHMGEDYVTVDLDKKLSNEDVDAIENMANAIIFANKAVMAHYPTSEELAKMPLRKQPKVTENIRVIEVDGIDFSPCGGTHTKTTAEVGLLKVKRIETYKAGIRIEFGCGIYALNSFKKRGETINSLMRLFSIQDSDIVSFCEQLLENQKSDRLMISNLKEQLYRLQVALLLSNYEEDLEADIKVISLFEDAMSMNDLRFKTSLICEQDNTIVIAAASENDKTHFVLAKSKNLENTFDMGALFKAYIAPLGIKGGGNPFVAQGGANQVLDAQAIIESIESALESIIED